MIDIAKFPFSQLRCHRRLFVHWIERMIRASWPPVKVSPKDHFVDFGLFEEERRRRRGHTRWHTTDGRVVLRICVKRVGQKQLSAFLFPDKLNSNLLVLSFLSHVAASQQSKKPAC